MSKLHGAAIKVPSLEHDLVNAPVASDVRRPVQTRLNERRDLFDSQDARMALLMQLTISRLSEAGGFFRPRSGGRKNFSSCHSGTETSLRLMLPSSHASLLSGEDP